MVHNQQNIVFPTNGYMPLMNLFIKQHGRVHFTSYYIPLNPNGSWLHRHHMVVSWNRATPSYHPFCLGFSLINHPFLGYHPIYGHLHIWANIVQKIVMSHSYVSLLGCIPIVQPQIPYDYMEVSEIIGVPLFTIHFSGIFHCSTNHFWGTPGFMDTSSISVDLFGEALPQNDGIGSIHHDFPLIVEVYGTNGYHYSVDVYKMGPPRYKLVYKPF